MITTCRVLLFTILLCASALAQYRTEEWTLRSGWNAIYLGVDPGETSLGLLLAGDLDIDEVWEWSPRDLDPTIDPSNPPSGSNATDEWRVWRRGNALNSTFTTFKPHKAYLIHTTGTTERRFTLKGAVLLPKVSWRIDGLNLVGFPVSESAPQQLTNYLNGSGIVDGNTTVYRYLPGDLGDSNPALIPTPFVQAKRGEAFWVRSNRYSDFYGPVSVDIALDTGLHFGSSGSLKRLVLRNRTDEAVTVTLAPEAAEAAPGESAALPEPTLLTRDRNDAGSYTYTSLGAGKVIEIPARDSVGISLSVDRAAMTGNPGDQYEGLLRVTDDAGLTEIYVPVSAEQASLAGLWVGEARISKVQNQLQRFQRDEDGNYEYHVVEDEAGKEHVQHLPVYKLDAEGNEILDGAGNPIPDHDFGLNNTAQEFALRIIVHVDDDANATLLSQVYAGVIGEEASEGEGNKVESKLVQGLTSAESLLLEKHLSTAVRLSCAHLPTRKAVVAKDGASLAPGSSVSFALTIEENHPSNPFLHTYHPDHDNKDASFKAFDAGKGIESFKIERAITLSVNAAASPEDGPQWGTSLLTGTFLETVTGIHKKPIAAEGHFALGKVSDIAVLQTPAPPTPH